MNPACQAVRSLLLVSFILIFTISLRAQQSGMRWSADGKSYLHLDQNEIIKTTLPANTKEIFVNRKQLTPAGKSAPLDILNYSLSTDGKKVLIYTNSKKVWRINTRGDYWVLNLSDNSLKK